MNIDPTADTPIPPAAAIRVAHTLQPRMLRPGVPGVALDHQMIQQIRDAMTAFLRSPQGRGRTWDGWVDLWNAFVQANRGHLRVGAPPSRNCRRCFGARRDPHTGMARPCPVCQVTPPPVRLRLLQAAETR